MRFRLLGIFLLAGLFTGLILYNRPTRNTQTGIGLTGMTAPESNFRKADVRIDFIFPRDHGPHLAYQTEWWYYTGNLQAENGHSFGYQLTFFRRGLTDQPETRPSNWAANQVAMAHFALTDPVGEKYFHHERLERWVPDLAGAQGEPFFAVWLQDWEVRQTGEDTFSLTASQDGISLDLELTDLKGPILQGEDGYSRKGSEPGNASYYYSQTRLQTGGTIIIDGIQYAVTGLSWMDHEYSTSALGAGVEGWDWFSIQLDDESEIMLFTLRNEDGSLNEYSSGTIIFKDGTTQKLKVSDFTIFPLRTWQSPSSGVVYPSGWQVEIPSANIILTVNPRLNDQEFSGFFTYWEGSVEVSGMKNGSPVKGAGYVELTGYAATMQGQF